MSFLDNEIYNIIPLKILDTNEETAKKFASHFVRSKIPVKDYHDNGFLNLRTNKNDKKPNGKRKSLLSRKEKLKLKMMKCPKGWNYNELEPLRQMWRHYFNCQMRHIYISKNMSEIEYSDMSNLNFLLAKTDYHGAEFQVVRSKNPSLVRVSGTCVLDKKNTFHLVSKDNKCRTIPKADCVFEIDLINLKLTVYGNYMTMRPAERSAKKIKTIMIPDL